MSDNLKRLLNQIYFSDLTFEEIKAPLEEIFRNEIQIFDILRQQIKSYVDSRLQCEMIIETAWEALEDLQIKQKEIEKVVCYYSKCQQRDLSKFNSKEFHDQYFLEASSKYELHSKMCKFLGVKNRTFSRELLQQAYEKLKDQQKRELMAIYKRERDSLQQSAQIKLNKFDKEQIKKRMTTINSQIEDLLLDEEVREFERKLEMLFQNTFRINPIQMGRKF